jgi:copper resistance protein C
MAWLLCFWSLAVPLASGHAILLQSVPAANSVVSGPDITISLQFNARVDSERSRVDLVLQDGKLRQLEIQRQSKADTIEARATGLSAGLFRIRWTALSADGHLTRGEYAFRVR